MYKDDATKLNVIIVPAFVIALLSACSPTPNDLSRSEAKNIISSVGDYPRQDTMWITTGEFSVMATSSGDYKRRIEILSEAGLATGSVGGTSGFSKVTIALTDQGAKYVKSISESKQPFDRRFPNDKSFDVAVFTTVCTVGEVTGIAYLNESKTAARIEYSEVCEETPFGALDLRGTGWVPSSTHVPELALILQRYDDGWRKSSSF